MGSVRQTFLPFFDVSIVTVAGLLVILDLRPEGPEYFSSLDVCSESLSAIASSSSSSDHNCCHFLHQFQNSSQKSERLCQCQATVSAFPEKKQSCRPISQNKTQITASFLVILGRNGYFYTTSNLKYQNTLTVTNIRCIGFI